MTVRLKTDDGKTVIVGEGDVCLYSTNTDRATRWNEYMAHRARSGKVYFYLVNRTMWQGESDTYDMLGPDEMKSRLDNYTEFDVYDRERIERFFPDFFTEDA